MRARSARAQRTPPPLPSSRPVISPVRPVPRAQLEPPAMQGGRPFQAARPLPASAPRQKKKSQQNRETIARRAEDSRSTSPSDAAPGSAAGKPTLPRKSKKQQARSRAGNNARPSPSPDRHQVERAITPASTPVIAAPGPVRVPENESLVQPVAPPPVVPAPIENPPQVQAQQRPPPPRIQSRAPRPILNDLSEDERARLHSAHQNAMQRDPNLATSRARYLNARKEFREKLRDALLKADPSVRPILDKIHRDQNDER